MIAESLLEQKLKEISVSSSSVPTCTLPTTSSSYFRALTTTIRADHSGRLGRYIWPTWILWGFDRLLRAGRILAFNHGYLMPGGGVACNATVERVADGFMRLRFRRPAHLRWAPGQSAHITMPSVSKFPFESHPFTIANADVPAPPAPSMEKMKIENSVESTSSSNSSTMSVSTGDSSDKELVFIIKKQDGFTRRLDQIAKAGGQLKIVFDGPYGHPPRLTHYDTVVFLACEWSYHAICASAQELYRRLWCLVHERTICRPHLVSSCPARKMIGMLTYGVAARVPTPLHVGASSSCGRSATQV